MSPQTFKSIEEQFRRDKDYLRNALMDINEISSPNPGRTFDHAIRDLEKITSIARRTLGWK